MDITWAGESIKIKMSISMISFTIHLGGLMEENLGSDSESFSGDFLAKKDADNLSANFFL